MVFAMRRLAPRKNHANPTGRGNYSNPLIPSFIRSISGKAQLCSFSGAGNG
jgi:hypothetical protein